MRAPRVPVEEQYRLIMECCKSGLSDHQWCLNNDINQGTFYNWVKRLIEVIPDHQNPGIPTVESTMLPLEEPCPAIEVMLGTVSIKISNDVDPKLLSQILKAVTGTC